MKNLIILVTFGLITSLLTGCGSDGGKTTTKDDDVFPTYSSEEDCSSSYLNPVITNESGYQVKLGIPGNTDCPYRKAVTESLFVEAEIIKTRDRNGFFEGLFNTGSAGRYCDYTGCWSFKAQCPPHFSKVTGNSQALIYANFDIYYGNQRPNRNYANQQRRTAYDDLDPNKTWCQPIYGSFWYDEHVDRVSFDNYYDEDDYYY